MEKNREEKVLSKVFEILLADRLQDDMFMAAIGALCLSKEDAVDILEKIIEEKAQ